MWCTIRFLAAGLARSRDSDVSSELEAGAGEATCIMRMYTLSFREPLVRKVAAFSKKKKLLILRGKLHVARTTALEAGAGTGESSRAHLPCHAAVSC